MSEPIQYAEGAEAALNTPATPGYFINMQGRLIKQRSVGAFYALADYASRALLLANKATDSRAAVWANIEKFDPDMAEWLLTTYQMVYLQSKAQLGDLLCQMAEFMKTINLDVGGFTISAPIPMNFQSHFMATNNIRFDQINILITDEFDQVTSVETRVCTEPQDWVDIGRALLDQVAAASEVEAGQQITLNAPAAGASGTMGFAAATVATTVAAGAGTTAAQGAISSASIAVGGLITRIPPVMIVLLVGAAVVVCFIEYEGNDVKINAINAGSEAATEALKEALRLQQECLDCQAEHPDDPTACAAVCKLSAEQMERAEQARRDAAAAALEIAKNAGAAGLSRNIIDGLKPVLYAAVGAYALIAIFKVINDKKE
jgi:hypothetical protein